jgi:hypothetical protein
MIFYLVYAIMIWLDINRDVILLKLELYKREK